MAKLDAIKVNGTLFDAQDKDAVIFARDQSLTTTQKKTGRDNIGAADDSNSVHINDAQSLTDQQKAAARGNIGAVAINQGVAQAGKALVVGDDGSVTLGEAGVPQAVAEALIALLQKVAYIDGNGQDYLDALIDALNPEPVDPFDEMTYENGQSLGTFGGYDQPSQTGDMKEYYGFSNTAARARMSYALENHNYIFSVTDSTKYNLAVYPLIDGVLRTVWQPEWPGPTFVERQGYQHEIGVTPPSWTTSASVNSDYVIVAFKKMDGTDFTANELTNMYGDVYTVTANT